MSRRHSRRTAHGALAAAALWLTAGCAGAPASPGAADPRTQASAPPAAEARAAGARETTATADAFRRRVPALAFHRQAERDMCAAGEKDTFNHGRDTYRLRCTRTLLLYFGADGTVEDRIREVDAAVTAVVRARTGDAPRTDRPTETAAAALRYYTPRGEDGSAPSLTYRWSAGGGAQNTFTARVDWEDPLQDKARFSLSAPDSGGFCQESTGGPVPARVRAGECRPVDQKAETARIRARHPYAFRLTLEDSYYELGWD
ncbi:hypothetical protein SMD11_0082 [Streptomyces albireticuli]|uniref:Lipoprotein n=1 Tax=Streptomyces albireticuli TaxID=1940 RepID=A0A1Z2KUP1_9ACTN|nr:hypothetical protein [Streptomyces albireticuli]ARZ65749.1 hypothetical protein SMD11_0082 [Streptomyces albireticuli]